MIFYAISALIAMITSAVLGLFVYSQNKQASINKIFTLFCLSVSAWGLFWLLWIVFGKTKSDALFFGRALNIAAIFISITYFHFITLFLHIFQSKKKLLILGYILSFIFFISGFTNLFVQDVAPTISFAWYPKPGIIYHFFTLVFFFYIMYSWYLMLRAIRQTAGETRLQITYVLIGTLIGFIGGSTSFYPVYNAPIPPFGIGAIAISIILITFAILRYHLFEVRILATEALIGAIALILLVQALSAETLMMKIFGLGLLTLFSIVGYFLIKSILKEISLRAELEKAYQELKKLDKAKSEFVSIASHQLRTPLTAIKGYISLLLEGSYGKLTNKNRPPIENVYQSSERLIRLINELLNISRIEAGKLELNIEESPIEEVIKISVDELKIQAEKKNLCLKVEKLDPSLPKIFIDKDKIKQVITNVIDNAIKYTNKGGVTIRAKSHDSKVRIEVTDTGDGMEQEEMSKLFKSFSRGSAGTKLSTEGAGLGLHIAKSFVEYHGGRIWAESPGKGKGSTVFIELPIKRESRN